MKLILDKRTNTIGEVEYCVYTENNKFKSFLLVTESEYRARNFYNTYKDKLVNPTNEILEQTEI